jgi:hypothetical protein
MLENIKFESNRWHLSINKIYNGNFIFDEINAKTLLNLIKSLLEDNQNVVLDFKNIEFLTTSFLNTIIGELYSIFERSHIKKYLSIINMSQDDLYIIKYVVETAKNYYG